MLWPLRGLFWLLLRFDLCSDRSGCLSPCLCGSRLAWEHAGCVVWGADASLVSRLCCQTGPGCSWAVWSSILRVCCVVVCVQQVRVLVPVRWSCSGFGPAGSSCRSTSSRCGRGGWVASLWSKLARFLECKKVGFVQVLLVSFCQHSVCRTWRDCGLRICGQYGNSRTSMLYANSSGPRMIRLEPLQHDQLLL